MQYIAVFDDVFLAFYSKLTGLFDGLLTAEFNKIIIGNGFGSDKAFFKIGVNYGSGFGCGSADCDGPGTDFFFTHGKVGLQAQ